MYTFCDACTQPNVEPSLMQDAPRHLLTDRQRTTTDAHYDSYILTGALLSKAASARIYPRVYLTDTGSDWGSYRT